MRKLLEEKELIWILNFTPLVCDVNKKFTSYLAGYPGSCHNSYVFSNIKIAQHPEKFFDQNQFLLADSAHT
ncbi:uncharacterized protein VP01_7484g1, partial [Puccinia sorghi]